jgi:hypothetical protein
MTKMVLILVLIETIKYQFTKLRPIGNFAPPLNCLKPCRRRTLKVEGGKSGPQLRLDLVDLKEHITMTTTTNMGCHLQTWESLGM